MTKSAAARVKERDRKKLRTERRLEVTRVQADKKKTERKKFKEVLEGVLKSLRNEEDAEEKDARTSMILSSLRKHSTTSTLQTLMLEKYCEAIEQSDSDGTIFREASITLAALGKGFSFFSYEFHSVFLSFFLSS
jgi:hypothetical protein